jgi:hypothetical protein
MSNPQRLPQSQRSDCDGDMQHCGVAKCPECIRHSKGFLIVLLFRKGRLLLWDGVRDQVGQQAGEACPVSQEGGKSRTVKFKDPSITTQMGSKARSYA